MLHRRLRQAHHGLRRIARLRAGGEGARATVAGMNGGSGKGLRSYRANHSWTLRAEHVEELHHDPVCRLVCRKCLLMRL